MVQPVTLGGDPEEPSLWVIPHHALNNIALIPTIKEDVITVQKMDVGVGHIRRTLQFGEAKCFHEDAN
jgi:hypothetical protein